MPIRVIEGIAFNFGVIPGVIHQHIFPIFGFGKAVMAWAKLLVFITGSKDRL
ncbi:hypothetical protein D3C81_2040920 [compost metagenome]